MTEPVGLLSLLLLRLLLLVPTWSGCGGSAGVTSPPLTPLASTGLGMLGI